MRILVSVESLESCNLHTSFYLGLKSLEGKHGISRVEPFFAPRYVVEGIHFDNLLRNMFVTYKPTLFMVLKGEGNTRYAYLGIKDSNVPIIFFHIDDPFELKKSIEYSKFGFATFTTDFKSVKKYKSKGVNAFYTPFGYHNFGIENTREYRYNVSCVSTSYPLRTKFLQDYLKLNSRRNINIVGMDQRFSSPRVSHLRAWTIAAQSKINLVFSDQPDGNFGTKNKTIEMMGQGCFCLVQNFPGLESLFPRNNCYDTFDSVQDLNNKISFYLQKNKLREEMAENGKKFVHKNYLYRDIVENMLEIAGVID